MIAYSTPSEPSTFDDIFSIPEYSKDLLGKIPYHSYLFSLNAKNIAILPTQKAIEEKFVLHNKSEDREKELQQYVAIPIAPARQGVTFLLQVDTCKKAQFGNDKAGIEKLAQTAILPYAQFLHMIYDEARLFEQLLRGYKGC